MGALVYLDRRSTDTVELPRDIALKAAETVQAFATETEAELERMRSLSWQVGSPELLQLTERLLFRLQSAGKDMHAFAGVASAAPCPDHIRQPGHGLAS